MQNPVGSSGRILAPQTLDELIRRLRGENPTSHVRDTLRDALAQHDFDNPRQRSKIECLGRVIVLQGNYAAPISRQSQLPGLNILTDGTVTEGPPAEDAWLDAVRTQGWEAIAGTSNSLRGRGPEERVVALQTVRQSGSDFWHINVMAPTRCPHDSGRCLTLNIRSWPSNEGAAALIGLIEHLRSITPHTPDELHDLAASIIADEMKAAMEKEGAQLEWKHDYGPRRGSRCLYGVEVEDLGPMLETTRTSFNVLTEHDDESYIRVDAISRRKIRSIVAKYARRLSIRERRGVTIGTLARGILGGRSPARAGRWRSTTSGEVTQQSRIVVSDGSIGAEIVVRKDDRQILRLLNANFEIRGVTLPAAALPSYIGKPLRNLIDHPLITDDMVVTALRSNADRTTGRYRDRGVSSFPVEKSQI